MTTLDLRSEDEVVDRDRLFDALEEADADEPITVEAGPDLTVPLTRYRLTRGRDLDVTTEHHVDGVVVEAGTDRGIMADEDDRLEALLVTPPPPTDAEHEPVHAGLRRGEFEPRGGAE